MSHPLQTWRVLYGWYFERKAECLKDPRIIFYGRYIDDCLSIIYADSEDEALNIINKLQIGPCIIEWNSSQRSQPFLDMLLFVDEDNQLQHKPFRKARSHQERIPWISHHPFDVKRGTFIGEMSRLATLSSRKSDYAEALKSLVALYVTRGYPRNHIEHWINKHKSERWIKRLSEESDKKSVDVLVLKSQFNTTWNYFSASQLSDIMFGYWRGWIDQAKTGSFNKEFPWYQEQFGDLDRTGECMLFVDDDFVGKFIPDITKINILNRKLLVSRKRTKNLFDFTNLWKRLVVEKMELDLHSTFNPDVIRDEIRMITGESSVTNNNNNQQIDERQSGESRPGRITHGSRRSISPERQVEANIWNLLH